MPGCWCAGRLFARRAQRLAKPGRQVCVTGVECLVFGAPANPVAESEVSRQCAAREAAKTVKAEAVSKEEPAEAIKVDAGAEAKDAAPKAAGEKQTATEAETEAAAESTPKRVKQSLSLRQSIPKT
eukprot:2572218-Rhodomonas_salina.1